MKGRGSSTNPFLLFHIYYVKCDAAPCSAGNASDYWSEKL